VLDFLCLSVKLYGSSSINGGRLQKGPDQTQAASDFSFSNSNQIGFVFHAASYPMDTGIFRKGKEAKARS
jgi:hypothetical protein